MSLLMLSGLLPNRISDEVAINEVMLGNRDMFEVVVRRYNRRLYRIGMSYLRDGAEAEDAMQNAYMKAFLNLRKFHRSSSFATWLTRIMINECLMMLRRPRFPARALATSNADASYAAPAAEGELDAQELKAVLEKAISDLPQPYRVVY